MGSNYTFECLNVCFTDFYFNYFNNYFNSSFIYFFVRFLKLKLYLALEPLFSANFYIYFVYEVCFFIVKCLFLEELFFGSFFFLGNLLVSLIFFLLMESFIKSFSFKGFLFWEYSILKSLILAFIQISNSNHQRPHKYMESR